MENKKMSLVWAVVILALAGAVLFISLNNKKEEMPTLENDQQYGDVQAAAKPGDTVSMKYTGRLEDGTVFDSNVDPKFGHTDPFEFTLGAGQVIAGWDKGIVGMRVGDKQTLTIAPEDAYGPQEIKDPSGRVIIPANSTLIFDVELLAIK